MSENETPSNVQNIEDVRKQPPPPENKTVVLFVSFVNRETERYKFVRSTANNDHLKFADALSSYFADTFQKATRLVIEPSQIMVFRLDNVTSAIVSIE